MFGKGGECGPVGPVMTGTPLCSVLSQNMRRPSSLAALPSLTRTGPADGGPDMLRTSGGAPHPKEKRDV